MKPFVVISDDFQVISYDTEEEALRSAKNRAENKNVMDFYVFKLIAQTVHHQRVEIEMIDNDS